MSTKRKKKKKGIAIPFLATILVSLIVIGIPVFYYYQQLTYEDNTTQDDDYYGNYKPQAEDSNTILFILDLDDTDGQDTFMLLRTMPIVKTFGCVPIANSTLSTYENSADTIENIYLKNGVSGVRSAVENTFEIKIDRYIKLNEESFQKICDILGGVNYYIPTDVKGFNKGQMYLSSKQIQSLITHYELDDEDRSYVVGSLISQMLTQTMGDRVSENLDNSFNALINIMETDVTTIDYQDSKKAIQYMFSDNNILADYKIPTGSYNANGQYIIDDDFKQELAYWFDGHLDDEEDTTETDSANNKTTSSATVSEEQPTTETEIAVESSIEEESSADDGETSSDETSEVDGF
jgi:anionic cell wall polymer biosynthesis LytR-Cps2A-Psr (LCP) family protein